MVAALTTAQAQEAMPVAVPLVSGHGVRIDAQDMLADAQRIPVESRPMVLGNPQTVQQIAMNLYIRRGMAQQAAAEGLDQDPQVQSALALARERVLSDALLHKLDASSTLSEEDAQKRARAIYKAHPERFNAQERVQIRHILIQGQDEGARQKAEEVLQQLKQGADFGQLAREQSQDSGSAARGGELGWFARGAMVPEFEAAAFALEQPQALSELVETKFGFHVLQLMARKPAGTKSFEEVRDELVRNVKASALQDARAALAQKIQSHAQPDEAAIAAWAEQFAARKK